MEHIRTIKLSFSVEDGEFMAQDTSEPGISAMAADPLDAVSELFKVWKLCGFKDIPGRGDRAQPRSCRGCGCRFMHFDPNVDFCSINCSTIYYNGIGGLL